MVDVFSKEWFELHQSKLVWFANTKFGRYVLKIKGSSVGRNKITKIEPSAIHWFDGKHYAEFRTNNKYALRLYHAFKPLWHLFHAWDMAIANNLAPQLNVGFDTFYPDADPESVSIDGHVVRQSSQTFADIRSGNGNGLNQIGTFTLVGILSLNSGTPLYRQLSRGLQFFDTSSIPDDASIISVILGEYLLSKSNNLGTTNLQVAGTTSTSTTELDQADYQTVLRTSFGSLEYADATTSAYNEISLNASGIAEVNLSGLTRYSLQIGFDIDNVEPTWVTNTDSRYFIASADTSGTSTDPKLVVSYIAESFANATASATANAISKQPAEGTALAVASTTALATARSQLTEIDRKTYLYKIYDTDDNFLGVWTDVISELQYSHEINNAGSSVEVELARNSETLFQTLSNLTTQSGDIITTQDLRNINVATESSNQVGSGSNVELNYRVDVYVYYGYEADWLTQSDANVTTQAGENITFSVGSPNGRRIFSGFISRYISRYGSNETTQVSLLSYGDQLQNYMIENAGSTTVAYNSYEPADIVTDIIDKYEAAGGVVSYTDSSVGVTSTTVSYTFNTNTTKEGMDKAIQLAPTDWFWYVDMGQNLVYYQPQPTAVTHTFILGKHIEGLNLEKSIEGMVNTVYATGGEVSGANLFSKYEDATSQTSYGQKLLKFTDNRIILQDSLDIVGEGEVDRSKDPRYRSSLIISDQVYDIENINLGDLVGFQNFGNAIDSLEMQIVGIQYEPDKIGLQLDTLPPRVSKRLEDIKRNLDALDTLSNPSAPS